MVLVDKLGLNMELCCMLIENIDKNKQLHAVMFKNIYIIGL